MKSEPCAVVSMVHVAGQLPAAAAARNARDSFIVSRGDRLESEKSKNEQPFILKEAGMMGSGMMS
jgi:hypothetical protein